MPHANPIPSIAYASLTGSADVSSAAPSPHAHPATPFSNASSTGSADVSSAAPLPHSNPATFFSNSSSPFNIEHLTLDQSPAPPSSSPRSDLRAPHFDFRAPHFALFLQVLHIAMVVVSAIAQRMDSDLHCLTLLQGCEAINCLYSIIRIQLTIDRHPERITPAELRRLAKASRYINRLARRKLDFSPFTTTDDNSASTNNEQQTTNNKQTSNPQSPIRNPQSNNPQSSLPRLNVTGLRSTPVCHSPGATLARTCQSLCCILKLLPDLTYDPSGTVATFDLANPASFSPVTLPPGARASSPAAPLPPANPAAPSPIRRSSSIDNGQLTIDAPTPHSEFRIPHFSPAPT